MKSKGKLLNRYLLRYLISPCKINAMSSRLVVRITKIIKEEIVLINRQILRTHIKRDVWQLVRITLVRVGVLTCSWQRRKPKCFDLGTSEWEGYSWQTRGVGSYIRTGRKKTTSSENTNLKRKHLVALTHKRNSKRSSMFLCQLDLN